MMLPIQQKKSDYTEKRKELLACFQKKRDYELSQSNSQYFAPNFFFDFGLHGIYKHNINSLYSAASQVLEAIIPTEYGFTYDLRLFLALKFTSAEIRQIFYTARKISKNAKQAVDLINLVCQQHEFFIPECMMQIRPTIAPQNSSVLLLDLPSPLLQGTSFHYLPVKYLFKLILSRLALSDLLTMRQVSRAFRRLVDIGSLFSLELYVTSEEFNHISLPFWFELPYRNSNFKNPNCNRSNTNKKCYISGLPITISYLGNYISKNKTNPYVIPTDSAYLMLYFEKVYLSLPYDTDDDFMNALDGFSLGFLEDFFFERYCDSSIKKNIKSLKKHVEALSDINQDCENRFSSIVDFYQSKIRGKNRWDFEFSDEALYKILLSEDDRPQELHGELDPMVIKSLREKFKTYLNIGLSKEDSLCRAYKENVLGIIKYISMSPRGFNNFFYHWKTLDISLDEFFLQLGKIDISVAIALAVSIHVWELRPDQVSNKTLGELIRYYCDKHSKQFRKIYPGDQLALLEFHDLMTAYINVRAWSMSRETVLEWSQIHPLVFGQLLLHPPFQLFLHEGEIVLECEREELLHLPLQLEKSNVLGYLTTSFDKKPKNNELEIYPDKKPEICPEKEYADFCLFHHLSEEAIKQSFYLANGTIGSRLVSIETQEMFKQKGIELIGWQERPESFYQDSPHPATIPSEPQGSSETVLTEKNRSSRWGYLTLLLLCGLGFSLVGGGAWSLAGHPGLVMAGLLIHKLAFTVGSVCAVILGGLLLFAALYLGLRLLRRGNASNEHKSHSYNSYQQFYQQELTAPSQAINTETHTETHGIESREDFKRVVSMGTRPKKATGQAPISLDSETGPSAELPQYH